MGEFSFFMPIMKMDAVKRTVSGYASTPAKDSDGEIVTLDAIKAALPNYMRWRNIREMHQLKAVGVAQDAEVDNKGLFLTAKIIDDDAWKKCQEGVYKGFSIGGRKLATKGNTIKGIEMTEISVVDRPANPECSFTMVKMAKPVEGAPALLVEVKEPLSEAEKALRKITKLAKKAIPAGHDGFSLPAKPAVAESSPRDNSVQNNKATGPAVVEKDAEGTKPYGDVKYADPGHQPDGKARYPIDTEDHIRAAWNYINKPKNAKKYSDNHAAGVKSRIISAWKDKIHPDGPPSAEDKKAKKLAKRQARMAEAERQLAAVELGAPVVLEKRMSTVADMSYAFDSLRRVQRALILEGKAEKDGADGKMAKKVGEIAKDLADVMSLKSSHEGGEATSLTDVDDVYVNQIINGDNRMSDYLAAAGGDPLSNAIMDLVKRAAMPTKAMMMKAAEDDVEKARKAMKECRKAIEDCHKLHKAAYIAKAAKAKKEADKGDDDGEFDHVGAMEKLQKAYGFAKTARDMGKAAMAKMQKAAARSGQRGQEAGDAEAGVYEVPAGVKDLSPSKLAEGTPPAYPDAGQVYAGKAAPTGDLAKFAGKDGTVPLAVAQMLLEKSQSEAELAVLRRMPVGGGGRPRTFDTRQLTAGGSYTAFGGEANVQKALFDGVDASAIGSGNQQAHQAASARLLGNMLMNPSLAKSITDPTFHGTAGA